jgi:hypothetical protein
MLTGRRCPLAGYVVTKQWAEKYPHTLAAFYRALTRAGLSGGRRGPGFPTARAGGLFHDREGF